MADTIARSGPANIGSGTSTLLTVTSGHSYFIKEGMIIIVNNTTGSIVYKLGIGGVTDALLVMPATAVAGKSTLIWPPPGSFIALLTTETLQVNADVTGGTGSISYIDHV